MIFTKSKQYFVDSNKVGWLFAKKRSGQNFGLLVVVNKVCDFSEIRFTYKVL